MKTKIIEHLKFTICLAINALYVILLALFVLFSSVYLLSSLWGCLDRGSEIGNPLFPGDSLKPDTIPGQEYSSFIPYSSEGK